MPPVTRNESPRFSSNRRRPTAIEDDQALSRSRPLAVDAAKRLRKPLPIQLITGDDHGDIAYKLQFPLPVDVVAPHTASGVAELAGRAVSQAGKDFAPVRT
jgi:hypothetical protein